MVSETRACLARLRPHRLVVGLRRAGNGPGCPSKRACATNVADVAPGLYGFSTATPIPLFPSLKLHYWASVLEVLRDRIGAKVVVVGVKG